MSELSVLRQQTATYIAANPDSVVLTREERTSDGAGGWTTTGSTPLPPQVVRIIQQRESNGTERRNRDGEVVRPALVLLAQHDANVQRNDTFDWDGMTAEVVWVQALESGGGVYELSCEVALR